MTARTIRLRLDPWPPEYDSAIQFGTLEQETSAIVDPLVEQSDWRVVRPPAVVVSKGLYFVDGVRRVDARVLVDHDDAIVYGLLGTVAVGCVSSTGNRACCEAVRVRRCLILGAGLQHAGTIVTVGDDAMLYEGFSTVAISPVEVVAVLQNLMREAEADLAQSLVPLGDCVFADGPLTYFGRAKQEVVGIIKRIYVPYLSPAHFTLVSGLQPGERTPLFAISDGKYDRYSWYLRVAGSRPLEHELAGILRLEVRAGLGAENATRLADLSARHLPRFASTPLRDPRAPQNLFPIGALEEQLRRQMGDALLIRRAIEKKLYEEMTA